MMARQVSVRGYLYLTARALLVVAASMLAMHDAGQGQSFYGAIRGAVTDPAGGAVAGVEVSLTNQDTNVARITFTNDIGQYAFGALQPGTYTIRASFAGFKAYQRAGVNIATQQFVNLDITLHLGDLAEEVRVSADAPLLETATPNTGASLSNQLLATLPNTGRNPFMMALTVPTAIHTGNPFYVRQQDQSNSSLIALAGGPIRGNNYLIDGVPITDLMNRAVFIPNIESIADMKVQVNTYDAEVGRSGGGIFNTTMRSGSNQWHGAVHVQQRPQPWAARNFFADHKPAFSYWLYGGGAGGPIRRDKTFFWVSTEGYKTGTPWTVKTRVPTELERQGDFSQTLDPEGRPVTIYDPLTTRLDPGNPGRYIRDAFPGNRIPGNRINPVGGALMGFYPPPDRPGDAAGLDNYIATDVVHDAANQMTGKIDHRFNAGRALTGTFAWYNSAEPSPVYFRGTPGELADVNNSTLFRTVYAAAVNHTWSPSPRSIVTVRWGYNRFKDSSVHASLGFDPARLGFDSVFANAIPVKAFTDFSVEEYRGLGSGGHGERHYISHNAAGNYSQVAGRHNFKLGGAYRQIGMDYFLLGGGSGSFSFTKAFTQRDPNRPRADEGNAVASLLLGYPSGGSITAGTPIGVFTRYYAAYLQDDFRLHSRLTLNYGVRYEYETDLMEKQNRMTVGFDRTSMNPLAAKVTGSSIQDRIWGGLIYAGVNGNRTHMGDPQKLKLGPRFGFAWMVRPTAVLRAGYGIFFAPLQGAGESSDHALGYTASTQYIASVDGGLTPAGIISNPFPDGWRRPAGNSLGLLQNAGGAVSFVDQHTKHGYVQQYSLDLHRELPFGIVLTVGYTGSRSLKMSVGGSGVGSVNINQLPLHLLSLRSALQEPVANPFFDIPEAGELGRSEVISRGQLLRPFPHFLDVIMTRPSLGYGSYNAFVLKTERRMDGAGFAFHSGYTFGKALDNYFGQGNTYVAGAFAPVDNHDLNREYSLSIFDVRHRWTFAPVWDLPFGAGKKWAATGVAQKILGGWNVSAVTSFQSGFPLGAGQQNNSGSLGGVQRPNAVPGVDPCTHGKATDRLNRWLNPAAFEPAEPFTIGNLARTTGCRGPSQWNTDIAIRKSVRLNEQTRLSFRVEALNATNTPKFNGPDTALGSANFGRITSQAGFPRMIQWMLRYEF